MRCSQRPGDEGDHDTRDGGGHLRSDPDRDRRVRGARAGRGQAPSDLHTACDLAAGIGHLYATRSLDEGRTWLPPVLAGSQPIQVFFDPETGNEYPQPGFPSAAVGPDGTVYVANEHDSSVSSGAIAVARSRDGGRTWSSSQVTGVSAFAFFPSIAVDSHGTVGVTWYDLRNDRPGDAALTADAWFASSNDRGHTWRQTHLAGPFDMRAPPFGSNGHQLGEYQGPRRSPDPRRTASMKFSQLGEWSRRPVRAQQSCLAAHCRARGPGLRLVRTLKLPHWPRWPGKPEMLVIHSQGRP